MRTLFVVLLSVISIQALARKKGFVQDTLYIRHFPHTITARVYVGEKASIFRLADKGRDRNIQYRPNSVLALGVGITLRGIGLNLSTSLPFHDKKEDKYGKTTHLDLQLHRYSPKLMLDAYFQRYTGFHLNSLDDVTAVQSNTEYPYFKDMRSYTVGASAVYVFNSNKFSMRSLVSQQDWQVKSAGSPLLGASFFWHQFKNDVGILPPSYKYPDFLDGHQPGRINFYGLTVNAGYGYTAVIHRNYFLTGAADVGAGPGYSSIHDTAGMEYHHIGLNTTLDARLGLGYNSTKWFYGLYFIVHTDRFALPYADAALGTSQGIFRVVVARRIVTGKRWLTGGK